jgi:hypothetical protein
MSTLINVSTNGTKLILNSTSVRKPVENLPKPKENLTEKIERNVNHHRSTSISKPVNENTPTINLTIKQNITTQNSKLLNITRTKLTLDIKTPMFNLQPFGKKDSETQTEEIFFKM